MIEPGSNSLQSKACHSTQGSSKKKKHSKRGRKQSELAGLSIQETSQKEENESEKREVNQESITTDKSQGRRCSREKAEDALIEPLKIDESDLKMGDESESPFQRDEAHNKLKTIFQEERVNETSQSASTCIKLETDQALVVSESRFQQNGHALIEPKSHQPVFLTPQKIKKDCFPVHSSISDQNNNQINSAKPFLPLSSVSSVSTASSAASHTWRHPAACPQKETQEVVREYRAEDRLQMLTKVLPTHLHSTFDTYLDLGCGNCEISAKIAAHFTVKSLIACDVYPVENSQRPLELPNDVEFEYIANENNKLTGVKDASLDLITCFMVLHHIEQIEANLLELKRITKEGGYLYIREHDVPANDIQLDKYLRQKHGDFHDGGVLFMRFFSKIQLKKMLAKFGFKHVADSMYNDTRPNRQKVYHSLFVKDSQLCESNSSEESTEESSDRSSSIAVSRFSSEQEGDDSENVKQSCEETKKSENQFHLFARTLFGNNSREGSPGQDQLPSIHTTKSYSNSQKHMHSKQLEPTQLVWRNSCQSTIQHGQKTAVDCTTKYKQNNLQIWRDQRSSNNNYNHKHFNQHSRDNKWNNTTAYSKQPIIFDDLHKNMRFKQSKIQDEFDFEDEEEGIFATRRHKESAKIPLHKKEPLLGKQVKAKVIQPAQLIDILS